MCQIHDAAKYAWLPRSRIIVLTNSTDPPSMAAYARLKVSAGCANVPAGNQLCTDGSVSPASCMASVACAPYGCMTSGIALDASTAQALAHSECSRRIHAPSIEPAVSTIYSGAQRSTPGCSTTNGTPMTASTPK